MLAQQNCQYYELLIGGKKCYGRNGYQYKLMTCLVTAVFLLKALSRNILSLNNAPKPPTSSQYRSDFCHGSCKEVLRIRALTAKHGFRAQGLGVSGLGFSCGILKAPNMRKPESPWDCVEAPELNRTGETYERYRNLETRRNESNEGHIFVLEDLLNELHKSLRSIGVL